MRRDPDQTRAERRGRRLRFLLFLAPGPLLVVAGVNLLASPWLLGAGLAWIAATLVGHRNLMARASRPHGGPDPELDP
ncbi:hypothetical protein [Caulobacter segnis]